MARHARIKFVAVMLALLLVSQCTFVDAKRPLGSSSNRKTSSSGGLSTRRQSSQTYGGVTKPSSSSNSRVGGANQDLARLSYSNQHVQPSHSSSSNINTNTNTNHRNSPAPIGWKDGPPPAYSATNPINGARTNNREAPPPYRPNNAPPPNYATATNTGNAYGSGTAGAHNTGYRSRANATGGFGASGFQPAVVATNTHGLQSGNSYPKQQFSPGNTYNNQPSSYGSMPAGTTFHSPGGALPPGATLLSAPPQSYSNYGHFGGGSGGVGGYGMPAGGYAIPAAAAGAGGGYYSSGGGAVPMGTPFIPVGGIPAGATMLSAPPQKSGYGVGSLLASGAAGAALGYFLAPTHTRVTEHAPIASGGGGGGDNSGDGKIIIINNGQPATVTNQDGATIITTGGVGGGQQQQPQPPQPPQSSPPNVDTGSSVPLAPLAPAAAAAAVVPAASAIAATATDPTPVPATADAASPAAPGNIICMQLPFNETDPNDATKMIEVTKVACFPAPTPEQQQAEAAAAAAAAASKSGSAESLIMQDGAGNDIASTTRTGATVQPEMVEGSSASVPLAPLMSAPSNGQAAGAQQLRQTDSGQHHEGVIMNSDNSPVLRATAGGAPVGGIGGVSNKQFTISAFVTIIIAYYLY